LVYGLVLVGEGRFSIPGVSLEFEHLFALM